MSFMKKEKTALWRRFFIVCIRKPNSVLRNIYLRRLSPIACSGTLGKPSTALHTGKDFAVSLSCHHEIILQENPSLSALASLLAPLWLPTTGVTRYPAAQIALCVCSDFPHLFITIGVIARCTEK